MSTSDRMEKGWRARKLTRFACVQEYHIFRDVEIIAKIQE